tara:strand:- start:22830 stop:23060 length:231 start_codon:yes stop_codon:yes gene_type:complete
MKFIKIICLLMLTACASHHRLEKSDYLEYASYQMNCPQSQLKVVKIAGDLVKVSGCQKSAEFEKMCSLGPCYLIKK